MIMCGVILKASNIVNINRLLKENFNEIQKYTF